MKKNFNTSISLVPSFLKQPWGLEITAFAFWGRFYCSLLDTHWRCVGLYSPLHSGQQWAGHPRSGRSFGCAHRNPPARSLSRPRAPQGSGQRETQRENHREGMTSLKRTQSKSCAQGALISLTTCPGNAVLFASEMNLSAPAVRNWNWIVLKIKLFQP